MALCPDCDCDVSHTLEFITADGSTLSCPQCQKKYHINALTLKKIKNYVKEIVNSNLKSNKVLDINWSFHGIGDGFFEIKNKGIFAVTDVDISVSATINGEKKTIGSYSLNCLNSSESGNLNDEITEDLDNFLVESRLINIRHEEIPEEQENYYGEEVIYWRSYDFIRLTKNFKCPLFVDLTYNLNRKHKIQKSQFLLTMKLKENWKAYHYDEFDNDCTIKLERVN